MSRMNLMNFQALEFTKMRPAVVTIAFIVTLVYEGCLSSPSDNTTLNDYEKASAV